jgi:hypothetical protein
MLRATTRFYPNDTSRTDSEVFEKLGALELHADILAALAVLPVQLKHRLRDIYANKCGIRLLEPWVKLLGPVFAASCEEREASIPFLLRATACPSASG